MKKIILDTNFLLIPGSLKIDIFSELDSLLDFPFEACVSEGVVKELESLSRGNGKDSAAARLGMELLKQKGLKKVDTPDSTSVDDSLLEIASDDNIVATVDAELKKKIKEKGCKVITLRQKKYLVMV